MKKALKLAKDILMWTVVAIVAIVGLPFMIAWALGEISLKKLAGLSPKEPPKMKPLRPDVVGKAEKDIGSLKKEEKEKDHEKTLSGIVNDAGGFVDGQPVTIQRNGYFNITDAADGGDDSAS